jgi:PAS domain S-box-containing protein
MKSLQFQIVWKIVIYLLIVSVFSVLFTSYLIEKASEKNLLTQMENLRDSKALHLGSPTSAFDFSNSNYNSYIIDKDGKLLVSQSYTVDQEIINLCKGGVSTSTSYNSLSSLRKHVATTNVNVGCLVFEGNSNQSVALGNFTRKILSGIFILLILVLLLPLWRTYKKIRNPLNTITENLESALISNWTNIKLPNTKLTEFQNLDKYSNVVLELLKGSKYSGENSKIPELKDLQSKFINKKSSEDASKFKMAVESAQDVILIVDKFGYINYANKALTNLTGLLFTEVENKKITDLWHKDDDETIWKKSYDEASSSKKAVTFTSWGIKKNSLRFESSIQISPIKNLDDSVDSFLVVERDVTEEKQKERLKTEFISVVSHELRTPMTVIRGYSSLLTEGKLGELNEKQKEYVNKINQETGQLLELANDMLDLQKFESGKIDLHFEKTSIAKFVENIFHSFEAEFAKKPLSFSFHNNLKYDSANIDTKYFARVVTNLLTNAYKYTPKGGVEIFLENPDEKHIVVAVKDTGIGIKEEALSHLFERFYQADGVMRRKQEGTGLGLSIVKRVTEAHGGMVWVESKEGVGSTFYVALSVD